MAYGFGGQDAMVAAVEQGNGIAGDAENYIFAAACPYCRVQLLNGSANVLYGKWNGAAAASLTSWDFVLAAGEATESPGGVVIKNVRLFSAGTYTYGTDHVVKGFI